MSAPFPNAEQPSHPLPPPRFSLRSLLIAITLFCCVLGLSHWVSPNTLAVVILILLVAGVHVLGNAIGTRLRDGPTAQRAAPSTQILLQHHDYAPATHLSAQHSLRFTMIISSGMGLIAGMAGGYFGMLAIYAEHLTGLALAITLLAFGIIGGVAGFLLGTFFRMLYIALQQSHSQH